MNVRLLTFPLGFLPLLLFATILVNRTEAVAQNTDSLIVVQAFTFDDDPERYTNFAKIYEYDGMVDFPEAGGRYEKILMYYTLKCDARTKADNYGCGEWDYSTWTRIWDDSVTHWEIGRFITPYGINLSLGPDGVTWVFDVTDYTPILTGTKRVTAGNSQELLDLQFHFIKGTPPRDPLSVTRLWRPGSHSYEKIVQDSLLEPIQVQLNPSASMYRINTRPQGGNFNGGPNTDNCAEFCDREHWLRINGEERFRWNVWKECGNIPVYPQGGTWLIDRAGWCPGEIVETQQHELTPFVTPGETITVDYGIENPPQFVPYGHWVFWADLIAYGPPNFTTDASVEEIIAPTTDDRHSRINPICSSPIVRIRNTGSEALTSLTIEYGIAGGKMMSYSWTGSLDFLEDGVVQLPSIPIEEWETSSRTFQVRIKDPNGKSDEYARNNYAESTFEVPERVPEQFDIRIVTNNLTEFAGASYQWELLDSDGNVVQRQTNIQSNTTLTYPMNLPEGCYTFRFVNPAGLGLDFWFYRDQLGTGSIQFRSNGKPFKDFENDFGNEINYQFRVPAPKLKLEGEASADTMQFSPTAVGSERMKTIKF
ncbi:MAG: peptide-N-glycosidase F-related protein, partial [Candidatus Kapaibacterium sp.]